MNPLFDNRPERDTPAYKGWRYSIFVRDQFTCGMCKCKGKGKKLEVHHIIRWADRPELRYLQSNGITLCEDCHKIVTGNEDNYVNQFKRYVDSKKMEQQLKRGIKSKTKDNKNIKQIKYRPPNPNLRF